MIICSYCKSHVLAIDRKCPACGSRAFTTIQEADLKEPSWHQSNAGEIGRSSEPTVVYQTIHQTVYVKEQRSPRSRWIALFLCLFVGFLGIHRFYTGKNGTGFLYLLTCGMFFMGVLLDFFSILFGYFRDKHGQLLS